MSCDPSTCNCHEQMTLRVLDGEPLEELIEDPIAEARQVESTKWAKLIYALGYPMDFTNNEAVALLDDDMVHEIAVAWYDGDLIDLIEPTNTVEDYEVMIQEELGL